MASLVHPSAFAPLDEHPVLDPAEKAALLHATRSAAALLEAKREWLRECEQAHRFRDRRAYPYRAAHAPF